MSEAGKRLIESAEQALAFAFAEGREGPQGYHVHIPEGIDVRRIREQFHMRQAQFAREFGFSVRTPQEWEQG
jgi:putative transcriptional regulator